MKEGTRGRPSDYKPEYCEVAIEMMSRGDSICQVAAHIKKRRETLRNWEKVHPEFAEALSLGRTLSQAWWEEQAKEGLWAGKSFNFKVWHSTMKNRFEYRDTHEHLLRGDKNNPVQHEHSHEHVDLTAYSDEKLADIAQEVFGTSLDALFGGSTGESGKIRAMANGPTPGETPQAVN